MQLYKINLNKDFCKVLSFTLCFLMLQGCIRTSAGDDFYYEDEEYYSEDSDGGYNEDAGFDEGMQDDIANRDYSRYPSFTRGMNNNQPDMNENFDDGGYVEEEQVDEYDVQYYQSNDASFDEKMAAVQGITPRGIVERMDATGNYDLIGNFEPVSQEEAKRAMLKWSDGNTHVLKKDYRGHTVEVRLIRDGSELKEMRLEFMYNPHAKPINRRVVDIMNDIADAQTISTCGLNAKPLVIYNKPSYKTKQATTFYEVEVKKSSYIREYAYRCLY